MDSTLMVALISFAGTLVGTAGGILAAGKLTAFRLEQLETKLDAQSRSVAMIPVMEEKMNGLGRRVSILEREPAVFRDYEGC